MLNKSLNLFLAFYKQILIFKIFKIISENTDLYYLYRINIIFLINLKNFPSNFYFFFKWKNKYKLIKFSKKDIKLNNLFLSFFLIKMKQIINFFYENDQ
jgi:hypothetical protein